MTIWIIDLFKYQSNNTLLLYTDCLMHIILNGKKQEVAGPVSIEGLLKSLGQDGSRLVVELNSRIINRDQYSSLMLSDTDVVEIVRLVGGG